MEQRLRYPVSRRSTPIRNGLGRCLCRYSHGRRLCSPLSPQFRFDGEQLQDEREMFRGDIHPNCQLHSWKCYLVDGVALDSWVDQFLNKLFAKVLNVNCVTFNTCNLDVDGHSSNFESLLLCCLKVFFLSNISHYQLDCISIRHTIADNVPSFLDQPSKNTGRIEPIISFSQFRYTTLPNTQGKLLVLQKTFQFNWVWGLLLD